MPPTTQMFRKAAQEVSGGRKLVVSAAGKEISIGQTGRFADESALVPVTVKAIDALGVVELWLSDGLTTKSCPTLEIDGPVPVLRHHRLALD